MIKLKGRYEASPPLLKVVQWLGSAFLLTVIALLCWSCLPDNRSTAALKLLQTLQTLSLFMLPPLMMAYLWSRTPAQWLHLTKRPSSSQEAVSVLIMLIAIPGINLIAYWNSLLTMPEVLRPLETVLQQLEEQAAVLTMRFMRTTSAAGLVSNLLVMALLPALAEELTFRGLMLNLFAGKAEQPARFQRTPHAAIWAVAFIFALVHMQFYGFLPRMLIGALLGYMLCSTGSLWTPVLMHFTTNAAAVTAYFVVFRMGLNPDNVDAIGTGATLWLGLLSLIATSAILFFYLKHLKQEPQAS